MTLQDQFGQIDIYLFDQILRGNIDPAMRVLDAGCGYGRNLVYLLRAGCEVFALDAECRSRGSCAPAIRVASDRLARGKFSGGRNRKDAVSR